MDTPRAVGTPPALTADIEAELTELARYRARTDLFYLLIEVLGRKDAQHQWTLDRCNDVQRQPDGMLDLWSREHYKNLCHKTKVLTPSGWTTHCE